MPGATWAYNDEKTPKRTKSGKVRTEVECGQVNGVRVVMNTPIQKLSHYSQNRCREAAANQLKKMETKKRLMYRLLERKTAALLDKTDAMIENA